LLAHSSLLLHPRPIIDAPFAYTVSRIPAKQAVVVLDLYKFAVPATNSARIANAALLASDDDTDNMAAMTATRVTYAFTGLGADTSANLILETGLGAAGD